ncbi:hypothetical protein BT93_K1782 [Corymbia citriodora subsp. variegata]|nr:hypothetical protein BT93_K1782 [Corymbia citriodora subsp. variegata]
MALCCPFSSAASQILRRFKQAMKNQQSIGNRILHVYMSCLFPHIEKWKANYGPAFAFTLGNMVNVCICDFAMVRKFC